MGMLRLAGVAGILVAAALAGLILSAAAGWAIGLASLGTWFHVSRANHARRCINEPYPRVTADASARLWRSDLVSRWLGADYRDHGHVDVGVGCDPDYGVDSAESGQVESATLACRDRRHRGGRL